MAAQGDVLVRIDGSFLEGGGQILRNATALSAIVGRPVQVYNIRAGRPKPGLMAQHLTGIQLLTEMCDARTEGAHLGSTEVTFYPRRWVQPGTYEVDCKTAGSVSLLLQSIVPPLLFSAAAKGESHVHMTGGTNVAFAPQFETLRMAFFPLLSRLLADNRLEYSLQMSARGCYPRGGGRVTFDVRHPLDELPRPPIVLTERGHFTAARIYAWTTGAMPVNMARRMAESAKTEIRRLTEVDPIVEVADMPPAMDSGAGIVASLTTNTGCILSNDYLLQRDKRPEVAGSVLLADLDRPGVCVDTHTQDQLVIFMALTQGKSSVRCANPLSNHTKTAIHVVEKLCGVQFDVTEEGHTCLLSCQGLGWTPFTLDYYR